MVTRATVLCKGVMNAVGWQAHAAGERMFVDYAGTTIDIVDAATGEVRGPAICSSRRSGP